MDKEREKEIGFWIPPRNVPLICLRRWWENGDIILVELFWWYFDSLWSLFKLDTFFNNVVEIEWDGSCELNCDWICWILDWWSSVRIWNGIVCDCFEIDLDLDEDDDYYSDHEDL